MLSKAKKARWMVMVLTALVMVLSAVPAAAEVSSGGAALYVSNAGSDTNAGTEEAPFATLEKARDAIRAMKNGPGLPEGGVTVYLREGTYARSASFNLTADDSGAPGSPVVYRSFPYESARITGGASLDPLQFTVVSDSAIRDRLPEEARDAVWQIDLAAQGITSYGEIRQYGFGLPIISPPPELFVQGAAMQLGRWPNADYVSIANVVDIGSVPRNGETDNRPPIFKYSDDRPSSWAAASDIWMFGYWFWDWADGNLKIRTLDTANKQITADHPSNYGIKLGQRYYYYNLLEEIDVPGEWYLDRAAGKLYLYPPTALPGSDILLTLMDAPLIKMTNASHIELRNLTFEASRGTAIDITGGANIVTASSQLRNLGMYAVKINGGSGHGVIDSEIAHTGMGGIMLHGGDRNTLTPAGHYAENNRIYDYSRIKKTYSAAVELRGVGNRVRYNLIHDAPHVAVLIYGNDHLIENNEIHHVLQETGDAGAIYLGRNWTEQGNIIRYNYLHDIGNTVGEGGQIAIYYDDMASGTTSYGNIIHRVNRGFLIGGGRNNFIENNLMISNGSSMTLDERGHGWAASMCAPGGALRTNLTQVPYQNEPWRSRYPNLLTILEDSPCTPKYNTVKTNVLFDTPGLYIVPSALQNGDIGNNLQLGVGTGSAEQLFMDLGSEDLRVRYDSQASLQDYVNPDVAAIGLRSTYPFAAGNEALHRLTIETDKSHSGESIFPLRLEETAQITIKARAASGMPLDLDTASISYSSDNPGVAEVSAQGLISPQGDGVALITATVSIGGVTRSISQYVFVGIDTLHTMTASMERTVAKVGEVMPLRLIWVSQFGRVLDLLQSTTFASSNSAVVSVDAFGAVTAVSEGTATVTASTYHEGIVKEASVQISVYEQLLQSVEIIAASNIVELGQVPLAIQAAMTDEQVFEPSAEQVQYVIENPAVAGVDNQGKLVALAPGRSQVEAKVTVNGQTLSDKIALAVYPDTASDVPVPWGVTHTAGKNGFARWADGRFVVASNTDNIWGTTDSYSFVHQDMEIQPGHTASITGTVEALYETNKDAAAGLMFRDSLDPGSKHVSLRFTPSGNLLFIYRLTDGGATQYRTAGKAEFPAEIRLVREGGTYTGYLKANGYWQEVSSITASMDSDMAAGMTLFSHTHNQSFNEATEASFSGISIVQEPLPLTEVTVTAPSAKLVPEQSVQLQVQGFAGTYHVPADLSAAQIQYASSDTDVVSVDSFGQVTAVANGTANVTVTVTLHGVTLQQAITLTVAPIILEKLDLTSNATRLRTGETLSVTAMGWMDNGVQADLSEIEGAVVTYTSLQGAIASVDVNGILTAHKPGLAVIQVSASLDGVTLEKKLAVVVYTQVRFEDDFEDDYAAWTLGDAAPVISMDRARSGNSSLLVDKDRSFMTVSFTKRPVILEGWFYDDGATVKQSVIQANSLMLGAYSTISSNHYAIRNGIGATSIPRSAGWHQVIFDYVTVPGKVNVLIDGQLADTRNDTGLSSITLGDLWANGSISNMSFDDIAVYDLADTTPPVTTATLIGSQVNGWYNEYPLLTLLATDEHTAVARTEYSMDGGTHWLLYEEPVRVEHQGELSLRYRSVDVMNRTESTKTLSLRVDTIAPTSDIVYSDVDPDTATVTATLQPNEEITVTNNGGLDTYTFYTNGSFSFEFEDKAGNPGSATATVTGLVYGSSTGLPQKPVLTHNNGHDTGLLDGDFQVTMNVWWGNNGNVYKLYENDQLIDTRILHDLAPQAQSAVTAISGKANGTYRYVAELTNAHGTTRSDELLVQVMQASPGTPVLSHDNWDGDGSYTVTMNLWWGTNGTEYRLYENDVLIDTQSLIAHTPQAQTALRTVTAKAPGTYIYTAELANQAGAAISQPLTVQVK
jgi:uncharacterized protein YjdB